MKQDFSQYDGLGLKRLIDQGEASSYEVRAHFANKIKHLNPLLNAVVHDMTDLSTEVERDIESPLSGLPILIKDLNPVKGQPFTNGSKLLHDHIAPADDWFVQKYRHAGLHIQGKTNTPEFGFTPITEPTLFGPTRNPWDLTRSPSGSSGGAAAAVASGMAPFAHASDGGGSIRMPAAMSGLFGFKPSRGLSPIPPYINQISVNHAVTRSVRDSAVLLDIIKGGTNQDLYPTLSSDESFSRSLHHEPKPLKIAVTPDWHGQVTIDHETNQAFEKAKTLLTNLGHEVEVIKPRFDFHDFTAQFMNVWIASGAVAIDHLGSLVGRQPLSDLLESVTYDLYQQGLKMSAFEYEESRVRMQLLSKSFSEIFNQYDVLMTPVMNQFTFNTGDMVPDTVAEMTDIMLNNCSFTQIANSSGQPAMSVPIDWTEEGLPVGMQFQSALGQDRLLFQLAKQLETANPWFYQYVSLEQSLNAMI
ncbi:amidase [Alkalibacillus sp. S2W]|uniref:amidase n=1 Tax=Alkalibacillus sp. S2W TaxID=3386553 RepID=UPI00398D5A48